ncbi:luciferase family protein [Kutzneria kofuensis]|uniref:Phospholipase/carboxylesterase n=1 Tax=Kutzneria kofuensis TaxID=103725 RepID=A0A7W9NKC4_9PSEU|nr:luciferase family protein [Kutzneria kofuensis]MBB5896482.1 phospholipase/carboxylesterase [Kutzneria kofuensis]
MTSGSLPRREGPTPLASDERRQEQLTQNAPRWLQERLLLLAGGLRGVLVRPAIACAPGSDGLHLAPKLARGPLSAFIALTEFTHLHPSYDGSLHVMLPSACAAAASKAGWGKPSVSSGPFLLFGPRDEAELGVVWALVKISYRYALGLSDPDDPGVTDVAE